MSGAVIPWVCFEPWPRDGSVLYSEAACRWLPEGASSWCEGGCLVLAQALVAVVGGELAVVVDDRGLPQHVVVRIADDWYVDGDGVSTEETLVLRWRDVERVPGAMVDRFRPEAVAAADIPSAGVRETEAFARYLLESGVRAFVRDAVRRGPWA